MNDQPPARIWPALELRVDRAGPGATGRQRPAASGKFLTLGGNKLYVRGVTYGTFRPDASGDEYPSRAVAEHDLSLMAAHGINAVRTYTVAPAWFLDAAAERGLWVLPSLAAERLVGHLNNGRRAQSRVERETPRAVRPCAGHPAVLGYAVANEIPAPTVRWLGHKPVERFLEHLCDGVRDLDPAALVSYVNYPTTEYLELPFVDFACFNVFLEDPERLGAYLARLHNLVGERPLLMTELGLDSLRHGEEDQAQSIACQLRTAFAAGCAGTFVYSWTDEWHRGGEDVHDWAFGLTDRDRIPKPALAATRQAYADVPFPRLTTWPRISVVVCAYNAEPTIDECLEAALRLDYPDYEVIVVNDGSTDATAEIARQYPVRLISTENRGLSSARNTGLDAARGEIVAYLDSDAYPDRHWLQYLANGFETADVVGVGGPNLPPPGDGPIAACVARSPGGPAHVLLSDTVAEHIPGCNMAFRAGALREVGGFDPRFMTAGDDVDMCWRLQGRGATLGFCAAALVWHHRRNSVRMYWRQQRGYGRAEALLERKWPEKYNAGGHFRWAGRIYDRGLTRLPLGTSRIYHGTWGTAPFQSVYERSPGTLLSLPLTPEWLLLSAALVVLAAVGLVSSPLSIGVPLAVLAGIAVLLVVLQASITAARAPFPRAPAGGPGMGRRLLTAALHMIQPVARLEGRIRGGLTLWRGHRARGFRVPVRRSAWAWSERWIGPELRLQAVEEGLMSAGDGFRRGGSFDRWDLELRDAPLGSARLLLCVEELGGGAQLVRYRAWPVLRRVAVASIVTLGVLSLIAGLGGATAVAVSTATLGVLVAGIAVAECGVALGAMLGAASAALDAGRRPTWAAEEDRSARLRRRTVPPPADASLTRAPQVAHDRLPQSPRAEGDPP